MKTDEQKSIRITEVGHEAKQDEPQTSRERVEKLKKPLIYALMAIVFAGCLYLIFSPSQKQNIKDQGLNDAVPQATETGMQEDKGKAYEKEMLEKKQQADKESLNNLSAYWNPDSGARPDGTLKEINTAIPADHQQEAMNSYRNVQHTLGSFYEDNGESTQLRSEVQALKAQLAQKESAPANPVANQLALMEKSYQMAAKYFPQTSSKNEQKSTGAATDTLKNKSQKAAYTVPVYTAKSNVVSALYREPSDSVWLAGILSGKGSRTFYTAGSLQTSVHPANSIKARIDVSQKVTQESTVSLRVLENMRIGRITIPKGSAVMATAKFQGNRLQLLISNVEYGGNIQPVELLVYDLQGQPGLGIPYSPERSAITDIVANMGNTGGTSISLSSNTSQQVTADLSKGLVQGVSGYFAKKVRMPQVTLKAGQEVYLIAKK